MYDVHTLDAPDLAGIDLNLLVVLRALLTERNVTRAAAKVGLSQSAASHALARLRDLYGDPLLVRSGRRLEPTVRAAGLLPVLDRALAELHGTIAGPEPFDPATARRVFRIGTHDYGQVLICEPMLRRLEREAPNVDIDVSGTTTPLDLLDRGDIEIAILVQHETRSGHASARLFEDDFLCMVRKGHPALKSRLTLRRWLELRHVVVAPLGVPGSVVDDVLSRRGLTRRVAARIPSFLAAPALVVDSDFVNTGPALLARRMAEIWPIVLLPPPLPLPSFTLRLVWHRRHDDDAGHRWLRDLVSSIARAVAQRR